MLLPCFAVALIGGVSTLDSNGAMEQLADDAVREHRVVAKVREEFGDMQTIREVEMRGSTGERSLHKQEGTVLAAFDEARSALDGSEVTPLWEARQHVVDLIAHGAALASGELDTAKFRNLADADADEVLAGLDAIDSARSEEFVVDTAAVSQRSRAVLLLVGAVVVVAVAATMVLLRRLRRALYDPLRGLERGLAQFSIEGMGHRIEVEGDREFRSVAVVVNEMAAQLEDSLAELAHKAFHDSLTGLANRAHLERQLERLLDATRSEGAGPMGAVVVLDLDGFKAVNDALGHQAGDEVLVEVARRLCANVRPVDLVARMGGDEFAILLAEANDGTEVDVLVDRLSAAISEPIMVAERAVVLGCSAGAQLVREGASPLDLLRHADIALYAAKREGRGRLLRFEPEMEAVVQQRLALEAELRVALEADEIEVVYQPIMDLIDPHVAGFEALARWNHPQRGVVGPNEFIPIAEATGLIVPLGKLVLEAACRQLATWRKLPGQGRLMVGVNVSPSQLKDHDFIGLVRGALRASAIPAAALVLEVTETVMADPHAVACLHELKQLGIGIALDDFGTGYSSLSYLQQLPIDVLKIDKSFIDGIDTHPDRAVVVNTVLRMARALGLRTVAEGIEDADQLDLLRRLGCQRGQGFYLCVPLPVDAVEGFLDQTMSAATSPIRAPGTRDLVAVRIGPVPAHAANVSLDHADRVLELLTQSSDSSFGVSSAIDVSPGVLTLVRHYIDAWRGVSRSGPTFTWEGFERTSVLQLLSNEWARITLDAADAGISAPEEGEAFRNAVATAILVALSSAEVGPLDDAAQLLHTWSAARRPREMVATST